MKPLTEWICDNCGEIIKQPEDGWFEWLNNGGMVSGFRIVHHTSASPHKNAGGYCHYPSMGQSDIPLIRVLGPDGLNYLLTSFILEKRVANMPEFVEIIRRLHLSSYEEARLYWSQAENDGEFDQVAPEFRYTQEMLHRILDTYGTP